jgi:hypothetical protein
VIWGFWATLDVEKFLHKNLPGCTEYMQNRSIASYRISGSGQAEPPALPAARGFVPDDRRVSAYVNDTPLGYFLGWRFWLCRKLKHRCLLTLA